MPRKSSKTVFLIFICLLLISCKDNSETVNLTVELDNESKQMLALPFAINTDRSNAYLSRDYLEIYLVSESDVLLIRLKLPDKNIPMLQTKITNKDIEQKIIHFQGPEVSRFVLPMGAVRPFPKDPGYTRREALTAFIICNNLPRSGSFEYGRLVTISLRNLDFGGANQYHLDPVSFKVSTFPP